MAKYNFELKVQNQTLQTNMKPKKYRFNFKLYIKAKEELQNLSTEKNQRVKRLILDKD